MDNHEIMDEVDCPICIETLKKPIQMLTCGHNLCHECVDMLYRSSVSNQRCPTCREPIRLGDDGAEELPRNRVLESLIDRISIIRQDVPGPSHREDDLPPLVRQLSRQELSQMEDLANYYIEGKQYDAAIEMLRKIENEVTGYNRINQKIDIANCYAAGDFATQLAIDECVAIISMLEPENDEIEECVDCEECDVKLRYLARGLATTDAWEVTLPLLDCAVKIIDKFYDGKEELSKLGYCASVVQYAAKQMMKMNKADEHKETVIAFLQEILGEMQEVPCDDEELKCLKITWCYKYIGVCCNEIGDYDLSIECSLSGIRYIRDVMGEKANSSRVLGHCYKNLGAAYEHTQQQEESEEALLKAVDIYREATDWDNNRQMKKCMALQTANLDWDSNC